MGPGFPLKNERSIFGYLKVGKYLLDFRLRRFLKTGVSEVKVAIG